MLKHDYTLQKIKEVFTSDPVLCFYDPGKKVTIQANASSTRLEPWTSGICPKAQRALTTTEQHWFQIKKKLLTVMFSTEHFHHYICRREAKVENDHKPLKMIIRKLSQNASPRIHFMLLMLLRYKLKLKYAQALRYALLTCYCMHTCCYPQQRKQPR